MATSVIEQQPLYPQLPVGQEIIFVVSNDTAVANQKKVKFIAEVFVSSTLISEYILMGTFKTTPNNAGVGIFDFRNIIENYVKPDNMAANGSEYKTTTTSDSVRHPIHLIDKYSTNNNSMRYMQITFSVEYLGATDAAGNQDANVVVTQVGTSKISDNFSIFNGYLKYDDILQLGGDDFGYNLGTFNLSANTNRFLTNAPLSHYANIEDYGTLAFLAPNDNLSYITLTYEDSAGGALGSDTVNRTTANGAYTVYNASIKTNLMYFGCFPGNLQNWSSTFQGLVSPTDQISGGNIEVQAYDSGGNRISAQHVIYLNCPNTKGYESIRLTWLNQWGVWEYYTFTKKSIKTISTKGTTYNQLEGTWNESKYRVDSYKGGKKNFRVNATEKIKMNTGFVTEGETIIFEELINSPQVYLLDGYQDDIVAAALNQYVTPVRVTSKTFTKKTIANDKLMQYTFEIEKSKTLRTQSV
tara:strand:- start:5907 stop:7313 length:1407 start_codon:yes stop_codon:yes gene_type:complete